MGLLPLQLRDGLLIRAHLELRTAVRNPQQTRYTSVAAIFRDIFVELKLRIVDSGIDGAIGLCALALCRSLFRRSSFLHSAC